MDDIGGIPVTSTAIDTPPAATMRARVRRILPSKPIFVRNLDAEWSSSTFLVAAVTTILAIRFFLYTTGYPQIGGSALHIAHMLWGGLFMVIALVIFISFLDQFAHRAAVLLGGIGFGAFIDELGKFITRDNNYFYQPTVALIYVVFILIFLVLQAIERLRVPTREELLVNALEAVRAAVLLDLDRHEDRRARHYLALTDRADPVAQALAHLLDEIDIIPDRRPNWLSRMAVIAGVHYRRLVRHPWFQSGLIAVFVIQTLVGLAQALLIVAITLAPATFSGWVTDPIGWGFTQIGNLLFASIEVLLVVGGIVLLRRSRLAAYRQFRRALLVSLFLTQFFVFLDVQFGALYRFVPNLLILMVLNLLIEREQRFDGDDP